LLLPGSLSTKVRKRKKGEKRKKKHKQPNHHPFPHNKSFTPGRYRDRIIFFEHTKKSSARVKSVKTPRQKETKPSYLDTISTDPTREGKKAAERIEDLGKKERKEMRSRETQERKTPQLRLSRENKRL
jgi:hypothetical protein